jgi:hypothetical protein
MSSILVDRLADRDRRRIPNLVAEQRQPDLLKYTDIVRMGNLQMVRGVYSQVVYTSSIHRLDVFTMFSGLNNRDP